jgi:kynureninase
VLAMDVQRLDPDFVIFPTYKWLLGPYGRAFLYVAKRHQGGIPLEQTASGRRNVRAENAVYFTISVTFPMRGASTWASAIISSRWRWRPLAWRWWPTGAQRPSCNVSRC